MLEIKEQRRFQTGDIQVAQHLREVALGKGGDDLWIDNDGFLNDEIGDEFANLPAIIVDIELTLALPIQALLGKLYGQGALVELFIEARLQRIQNRVGGSDYSFCEFRIGRHNQGIWGETTDCSDWHGYESSAFNLCSL